MTHENITADIDAANLLEMVDDEAPCGSPLRAPLSGRTSPITSLPLLLLQEALTRSELRRVRDGEGLCLLVDAPSSAWVAPLEKAIRSLGPWSAVETRDGTTRYRKKPEDGAAELAERIAAGQRVAAVSHSPSVLLPPCLLDCADIRVTLGQPSDRVIREAIKGATGTRPRSVPPRLGLDLTDLLSCIRMGSTAASCVARLREASKSRSGLASSDAAVPHVLDLHGYGAATDFARNLLADLEAWREQRLPFDQISRTLLLVSEPGLGKSTWCRALARSARLPLVELSIASLFSTGAGYLSDISHRIEQAFQQAANIAPALLFIDEIDALPNRDDIDPKNRDYWQVLISQFLILLDTAASRTTSRLIIVGATNHEARVDPALRRPGRLHPTIRLTKPDTPTLAAIMRQHLGAELDGIDLTGVASLGSGASGADVVSWVRDAGRAARNARRPMVLADLRDAVAPPDPRSKDEIWRAAVHEAGHVVAAAMGVERVRHVDIVMSGTRGGKTLTDADRPGTLSRDRIEAMIITALSGRAAEATLGLGVTSGAHDDLRIATGLAVALHASYGLGESLTHRAQPGDTALVLAGDPSLRARVDEDLRTLHDRALDIMSRERVLLVALAEALVRDRVLGENEIRAIVADHRTGAYHG